MRQRIVFTSTDIANRQIRCNRWLGRILQEMLEGSDEVITDQLCDNLVILKI